MSASASAISGGSTARAELPIQATSGIRNEHLGLALFIVSEAVMFAAIFAQYLYNRALSGTWPAPQGLPSPDFRIEPFPLGLVLTVLLVASGFTAHSAQTAAQRGDRDRLTGWLIVTILLGLGFLGGQAFEYTNFFLQGFTPAAGIYGSSFFALTGLHGIHVTAGVIVLIGVLVRAFQGHFTPTHHFGVDGSVLYWHFVDVVWLALYAALYLF